MTPRARELAGVLLAALRHRPRALVQLAAWSVVETLPAFVSGRAVALAVDDGFLAGRPLRGMAWLSVMGVAALVGAWATRAVYPRLAAMVEPFRDDLVRRVVTGTLHRSTAAGGRPDTAGVARLTHQVEIVREAFAGTIMVARHFVFTVAGALIGILALLPVVTLLVVPPLVIGLALFAGVFVAMAARQRELVLADERIAETTNLMAGGLRDVVACGAEDPMRAAVAEHVDAQAGIATRLARLTAGRTLCLALGGWLPVILVLVAAPWLVRQGATAGAIVGALTYLTQSLQPALHTLVQGLGNSGLWLVVTLDRIIETSHEPGGGAGPEGSVRPPAASPRVTEGAHGAAPAVGPGGTRGTEVELRAVTFGYGTRAEPVIENLDLTVSSGEHIAVVGPSGIGKSTLAGLLTGMLQPRSGEVRLGGTPLRGVPDMRSLARRRTLIPQEAYVFAGTVEENLTYLRPDATPAHVGAAVEAMGLGPVVRRLGGYAAGVDPSMLSSGERQLIALARAYLADAPLAVLDEATCHLDPGAEERAEHAFAVRGRTLVVIAHRVSSALRADRIVVMDGTNVTIGTHPDLLTASTIYRDLVGHWGWTEHPEAAHA